MLPDAVIISVVNTCVGALLAVVLRWMSNRAARHAREAKAAAEEASKAVSRKLDVIEQTGEKTHQLVNSAMTQQLKISAILARRVAALSGHADDEVVAKAAEAAYKANLEAQPKPERESGKVFHGQKD